MRLFKELKNIWYNKKIIFESFLYTVRDYIYELFGVQTKSYLIYKWRKNICDRCKFKSKDDSEKCVIPKGECCSLCGCMLKLKLRHKDSYCPIGKWSIYVDSN
jgi:hypothetical protein